MAKAAKRSLLHSLNIALITSAVLGAVATSVAVPIQILGNADNFERVDLYKRNPLIGKVLGLSREETVKELKDMILVDEILIKDERIARKRRRKRSAAVSTDARSFTSENLKYEPYGKNVEERLEIYQKSTFSNEAVIVCYYKNEDNPEFKLSSVFSVSGPEAMNLIKLYTIGLQVLGANNPAIVNLTADLIEASELYKEELARELEIEIPTDARILPETFADMDFLIEQKLVEENIMINIENDRIKAENAISGGNQELITPSVKEDVYAQMQISQQIFTDNISRDLANGYNPDNPHKTVVDELKEQIYHETIQSIMKDPNSSESKAKFRIAFSEPSYWMDAIAKVIVNHNEYKNPHAILGVMHDYVLRFSPYGTEDTTNILMSKIVDIIMDSLPVKSKAEFFAWKKLMTQGTNLKFVDAGSQITKAWELTKDNNDGQYWMSPSFNMVVNKPNSRSKMQVINVSKRKGMEFFGSVMPVVEDETYFVAKTIRNPKSDLYGILSFDQVHSNHREFMTELIDRVNSSSTDDAPELIYLEDMAHKLQSLDSDVEKYHLERIKDIIESKSPTTGLPLNGGRHIEEIRQELEELFEKNAIDLVVRHHAIDLTTEEENKILEDLESDSLYRYEVHRDMYEVIEQAALKIADNIGLHIDKAKLHDFISKKRRRRRRRR